MRLAPLLLLAGCAANPIVPAPRATVPQPPPQAAPDPQAGACAGVTWSLPPPSPLSPVPLASGVATAITVSGNEQLSTAELGARLRSTPGPIDAGVVADDVARLMAVEGVADVVVALRGGELTFVVSEHPRLAHVFVARDDKRLDRHIAALRGERFLSPLTLHRWEREAKAALQDQGFRAASIRITTQLTPEGRDVCVHSELGPQTVVASFAVNGVTALSPAELDDVLTIGRHGFTVGQALDEAALNAAIYRLQVAYYNRGHLDVRIDPANVEDSQAGLVVTVTVIEGPSYRIDSFTVTGADESVYRPLVAPVQSGAVFDRSAIVGIVEALRARHPGREVEPRIERDPATATVDVELVVLPAD